jgi:glycosyltransferase involved in cell wall biosynthesis
MMTHMFVVPAYGEPQWLERCLDSLERQTHASRIAIATSTPNAYLEAIATRRRLPLIVNPRSGAGIGADWNFALAQADADWVSLAHQDDWYDPEYVAVCLDAATAAPDALLAFTDATETIDGDPRVLTNTRVKRALCAMAFVTSRSIRSRLRRRLLLAFGNPIPCPSVMFNRRAIGSFQFDEGWKSNLDWRAWLTLADRPGAFVYVPRRLVHRTVHANATTTRDLSDRAIEDDRMLHTIWPAPIAAALSRVYARSRRQYEPLRRQHE